MPANLLLLFAAAIWGFGFVAQSLGMEHLSPFMFNGLRFLIGAVSLLPLIVFFYRRGKIQVGDRSSLLVGSAVLGILLFIAASFQQVGLQYTTAANAGFITGLYIVLVPILGLALKHKTGMNTWLGCAVAVFGLYFLSITDDFSMGYGDALQLFGALFWAMHILAVGHFARKNSAILLAGLQFIICGLLSLLVSSGLEFTQVEHIAAAWGSLAFAGIVSVGIAYTLQVVAQKRTHPAHAAIILSLETVFAAIGGILFLGENMDSRALFGCGLMLVGMLISQVPLKYLVKTKTQKLELES
ncbi:DMT family transporter [Shewanella sp. D64]|uniref:DMT family transporter n=1 Tax=unclassified Shewanella TaxID=196818 RepID=UPI0022BA3F98|nr:MULTISPECIES: DMT family transporter [unclassified Shewanella]MEC4727310.1 DMT family transporter [Shewanella sp. D64]MEC4739465.1 DMT family transporter [Shewanella sp. E94]WBJ96794.1 DMT family transporter [Shewanella sp. MTB7]